jgi:uncharacterized protein YndB with AHSA1/START domain
MTYSTHHHTFAIEREVDAPPALAFFAWANADAKAQWFVGPAGWELIDRQFDFRPGGTERAHGRFPDGKESDFQCRYHDIVTDSRIIYAFDMYVNGKKISVSLASVEFFARDERTLIRFTEQIVHLDGYPTPEDREMGSRYMLDAAAAFIDSQAKVSA